MQTLLDTLFLGEYSVCERTPSPEYWKLINKIDPYTEKIRKTMGNRFLTEYTEVFEAASAQLQMEAFREGVRFGFRLIGELSQPEE